jgi:hypothetical protein
VAVWTITRSCRVYWVSGGVRKNCGKATTAMYRDVLDWACREAAVFDVIESAQGKFVRQQAPPNWN